MPLIDHGKVLHVLGAGDSPEGWCSRSPSFSPSTARSSAWSSRSGRSTWARRENLHPSPVIGRAQAIEEARNFALAHPRPGRASRARLGDLVNAVESRNAKAYAAVVDRFALGERCLYSAAGSVLWSARVLLLHLPAGWLGPGVLQDRKHRIRHRRGLHAPGRHRIDCHVAGAVRLLQRPAAQRGPAAASTRGRRLSIRSNTAN